MKLRTSLVTIAVSVVTLPIAALAAEQSPPAQKPGLTLTWNDEFDGAEIDRQKWELPDRPSDVNNEQQYYHPGQLKLIENGILRITATDEPMGDRKYRSGIMLSHFTQAYGRFECRAKLPRTQGMWPAFWLLPRPADWPRRGEIDVLEGKGKDTAWFSNAYHYADPKSGEHRFVGKDHRPVDASSKPIDLADAFHVYAVEWEPGQVRFYFDDARDPIYTITSKDAPVSDQPMGVILNLAIGGWFGGDVDATTKFPQHFDVDYVRVWKRNDESTPTKQ